MRPTKPIQDGGHRKVKVMKAARKEKVYTEYAQQYRAIKHDPMMLQINMLVKNSKMTPTAICNKSGISKTCLRNWMKLKTRRPQGVTMKFVLRVLGYDIRIVQSGSNGPAAED
jgi:hypothetical protein